MIRIANREYETHVDYCPREEGIVNIRTVIPKHYRLDDEDVEAIASATEIEMIARSTEGNERTVGTYALEYCIESAEEEHGMKFVWRKG